MKEILKDLESATPSYPPGTIPPVGDEGVAYVACDVGWMGEITVDPDN